MESVIKNLEEEYVHKTYNKIAIEFSDSRYKVWDSVHKFIMELPTNSSILEAGCGNGKNLMTRSDIIFKGCDISEEFVQICKSKKLDVELGDITKLHYKDNEFDYSMSIAVIHHMSSYERRLKAINELIRVTKPSGKIFIEVWALEQGSNSRFNFDKQDLLIPFKDKKTGENLGNRFYHVFKENELNELINNIKNIKIINSFYEKGNWGIIIEKII